jgi:hypothetical protein
LVMMDAPNHSGYQIFQALLLDNVLLRLRKHLDDASVFCSTDDCALKANDIVHAAVTVASIID